jgi:hypothetical protein
MGGGGGGGGGKSQIKWSAWRATVTRTQVEIRPWMSSGSNQNFNFTSSIHGTASGLSFPGLNGGTTFRCFVYKISAS